MPPKVKLPDGAARIAKRVGHIIRRIEEAIMPVEKTQADCGEIVKGARKAKGWTRPELARKIDCTVQSIYYWEHGVKYPVVYRKQLEKTLKVKLPDRK